ncbi:alpha/beta hydrolase [Roseomonas mucosa]|uniref:alpha/beta hydrolase n=1 Tax=Roseomonas mucosa TaxID=207340 RepID=UPI0028CE624E|nr:alpha/beta hydrolase [Roseomonas mucosa]MDT8354098.1 alpha/beta hydrolase [Roseomonas mucosa]
MMEEFGRLDRGDGVELAWAALRGTGPTVVFLGGYRSDMEGTKALYLRERCSERGQAFLRLDYSGHGSSGGRFEDGTITRWTADAAAVIDARAPEEPLILVGSSMGGWIALLLARLWGEERVHGVLGIAAAPDFTEVLIPDELTEEDRLALARDGVTYRPSDYGDPMPFTAALLEDGRNNLLLGRSLGYTNPVKLLQGMRDAEVPWRHALRIVEAVEGPAVSLTLVKDGDHRLSRPADLALLWRSLNGLLRPEGT